MFTFETTVHGTCRISVPVTTGQCVTDHAVCEKLKELCAWSDYDKTVLIEGIQYFSYELRPAQAHIFFAWFMANEFPSK